MVALDRREAPPKERRPRLTLDGWRGRNCSIAGGGEQIPSNNIGDPIQDWEARLYADRNAWDIGRRQLPRDAEGWLNGGGWASRRLTKQDAADLLGRAFADIDRGCA